MTSPFCPPQLVPAPAVVPWRYGLLNTATIIDESDEKARCGVTYKSPACAGVEIFDGVCPPDTPPEKVPTDLDRDAIVTGDPFTVYAYLSCRTTTIAAMRDEVRTALTLAEPRAVEEAFWIRSLATPGCTILNTVPGEPGALGITGGVAALESFMASNFGGLATFHADRGLAAFAAAQRQIEREGGGLTTTLGSRWAFYAGGPNTGPDGLPAPDGFAWMYATSQVTLRRFPVEVYPDVGHELRHLPTGEQTNEPVVIAERTWVGDHFCTCAAVLVSASCAC